MPSAAGPKDYSRPAIWQVLVFWALAVVIVAGPYLGLMYGMPALMDIGVAPIDDGADRLVGLVRFNYWPAFGIYVVISIVFTPTYDPDRIGFLGGLTDNPFTLKDDWERQKRTFQFMLLPGKTVWVSLVLTKRFIIPT